MLELYINDIEIDLVEGEYIAIDLEVNNLGSIQTRQGVKSNDFSIRLNSKNIKALGFTTLTNLKYSVASVTPFVRQTAFIKQNGNYLAIGFIQIVRFNNNETATISFYGGNADWFTLIKDVTYCDLDFSEYAHNYTASDIVASFNNTEGYIYPLIDYGRLTNTPYGATVEDFAPAIFVQTILKKAFAKINYKLGGNFISNIYYKRLIMPFSKKGWLQQSEDYINEREVRAFADPKAISNPSFAVGYTILEFENETKDDMGFFNNQTFQTDKDYIMKVSLTVDIIIGGSNPNEANFSVIEFNGVSVTNTYDLSDDSYGIGERVTATFAKEIEFKSNRTYEIAITRTFFPASSDEYTINSASFVVLPNALILEGQQMSICNSLPNVSISELLLTLCYQFALFFQVNQYTRTVNVFQFQDLYRNIPKAKNWSSKLDYERIEEINFTEIVQNYGKRSVLKYQENENDTALDSYFNEFGSNFGSGVLSINNDFISDETILLESKFAPTINQRAFNESTYIPFIPIYQLNRNDEFEPTIDPKPRILILSGVEDLQDLGYPLSTLTIEGELGNEEAESVPFAYFFKETLGLATIDNFDFGLAFDTPNLINPNDTNLIEKNYMELSRVFNSPIYLKARFKLSQTDIDNLDFSLPIYLGYPYNAYFFLNKVKQFRDSSTLTECELIQLQ